MSGGAYDYLCYAQFPEIVERISDLKAMESRLIQLDAPDVAKDVRTLIGYCERAKNSIEPLFEKLSGVFQTIEWMDSGDIGEDIVQEELEDYRHDKNH